jgi:hypothetical protein
MEIKKIGFGDEGQAATAALLARLPAFRDRALAASADLATPLDRTRRGLDTLQALDRQHGGTGRIAVEGVGELVTAILSDLARVEAAASGAPQPLLLADASDFLIGGLWALHHRVAIDVEPVVNARPTAAQRARSRSWRRSSASCRDVAHVAPRRRPERSTRTPVWRILPPTSPSPRSDRCGHDGPRLRHTGRALPDSAPGVLRRATAGTVAAYPR